MKLKNYQPTVNLINFTLLVLYVVLNSFSTQTVSAQQLAFPSAAGAGAYSIGGRGGEVIHVTNLSDSGSGSLREALLTQIPRYIIFDVSGVINLESQIYINGASRSNFTVNGFSAPLGGITITGAAIRSGEGCTNMIWRGIRFRNGYLGPEPNSSLNTTCIGFRGASDVIVDRCSFAYAKSKGVGISTSGDGEYAENITIQNCLFGESKQAMLVGNSDGEEFGSASIIRNVTSNVGWRHPKGGGAMDLDVINNFHNNWQGRTIRMDAYDFKLNLIGNHYQGGGVTGVAQRDDRALFSTWTNTTMSPQIWDEDNYIEASHRPDNYPALPSSAWFPFYTSTVPINPDWFVSSRLPIQGEAPIILSSQDLKSNLFPKVGASEFIDNNGLIQFYRDNIDTRLIDLAETDAGGGYISTSDFEALANQITIPNEVRPADFYQSNPHIPEIWFQANVPEGQNHNDIAPSGYTWLEEYLNQVDVDTQAIAVESIAVTPNTSELQVSETINLVATISPENATNQTGVWSSSDETIATVDANGLVTAVSEGEVTITFTSNDGGFTDTSQITVFPEALQASAGDDQQICVGESATLSANGGTNYVWSTGETTASIEVTPTETTTYTVTVSDDNGQTDEASVTVTVNAIPIANAGEDQTICEGEIITLTASGGDTYLWSTGETTASIEVSPTVETVYTVEAITNDCSSSDSVTVFMNEAPDLSITEDVAIMEGESITLTASGGDNYEWSSGETTASITVSPESTTSYTVTSLGVNGCSSTAEVTVTVVPELIANAGNDVTICNGESVTLNASGGSSYSWNTGDTGAELSVSPATTTTYTVTVSDILGNSETDNVTITVNEVPNVSVSENLTIMEGENATLTANGATSYVWNTGETSNTITVSPLNTTTYSVTGASNNCEATAEVTVTVVPELTANAGNDVTICNGESVTLNATGGSSYSWNTGDTSAVLSVSPSTTTTYTVTVSDAFGNSDSDSVTVTVNETPNLTISDNISLIEGESTTLSVSGASSYLWNTGQTTNSISVSPTQTTTYTVIGTSNSCSAEAEVTVTVEPLFVASAGLDKRVCDNVSYEVVLTANEGDSYLWSTGATTRSITVSPLSTTSYTVTVTQGAQEDSDDVTVFVDPSPNVVITNGANVDILTGDFVTLSATGANSYEWNNGATQPNIAVSPSATTTYEVKGYIGECYEEKQVDVNVYQPVEANAGENLFLCLNEVATLTASGGDEYLWSTGETTQTIEVSPEETTDYTVTVFNPVHFDEATVTVEIDASCDINGVIPVEETTDFSFDMFPNPASKMVNLRFNELSSTSEVNIYDLSGVLVKHNEVSIEEDDNISTLPIDISALQAGVYVVKLLYNDDVITEKLIVE